MYIPHGREPYMSDGNSRCEEATRKGRKQNSGEGGRSE